MLQRLASLLLIPVACCAMYYRAGNSSTTTPPTVQWLFGASSEITAATATRYYSVQGVSQSGGSFPMTTAGRVVIPALAGTISELWCLMHVDGTNDIGAAGATATITLMKNGSATALSNTITGSTGNESLCSQAPDADAVAVVDGDLIEMRVETANVTGTSSRFKWHLRFEPTDDNHFMLPLYAQLPNNASALYYRTSGPRAQVSSGSHANSKFVVPAAGTIGKIVCAMDAVLTAGTQTITVNVNNSDSVQAPQFTTSTPVCSSTALPCATDTDDVALSVSDTVTLKSQASSPTPNSGFMGCTAEWIPTTRGDYFLANTGNASWSSSVDEYGDIVGVTPNDGTQWTGHTFQFSEMKASGPQLDQLALKSARVLIDAAPTSTQTWTMNWLEQTNVNTGTPAEATPASCVIDNTCASAPCTCTVDLTSFTPTSTSVGPNWYEWKIVPANTPTAVTNGVMSVLLNGE